MGSSWEEDIVKALRNLGGTAKYVDLYAEIELVRTMPLTRTWQEIVRRTIQTRSSDSQAFEGKQDIFFAVEGVGKGIWGLRDMAEITARSREIPSAADTSEIVEAPKAVNDDKISAIGNETPERVRTETYRILRDTRLARQVKLLHRGHCQVCGDTIQITAEKTYSEAHHIIPLGGEHKGPDTLSNILVLCPNHHAMMDMGLMALELEGLQLVEGHTISPASIKYHNETIYQKFQL